MYVNINIFKNSIENCIEGIENCLVGKDNYAAIIKIPWSLHQVKIHKGDPCKDDCWSWKWPVYSQIPLQVIKYQISTEN